MNKKWPDETIMIILFMATMLFGHTYIFNISLRQQRICYFIFIGDNRSRIILGWQETAIIRLIN